jgi:hypothetical protein
MNTHFVLDVEFPEDDDGEPLDFTTLELADENGADWRWMRGQRFARGPQEPIALQHSEDDDADARYGDYLVEPIPLLSRRLRDALLEAGVDNVDWYETRIVDEPDETLARRYLAANVIGLVAAADPAKTRSERSLGRPGADEIDAFVPDPAKIRGLRFFRLAEHRATLVVDATVKAAIERRGIDTLDLIPLEGWSS